MSAKDLSWLRELPGRPLVVAEIKPCSPFGWTNPYHWDHQLHICEQVGDIISVHTDPMWGGSWDLLSAVAAMTHLPILAKGFHPTIAYVERALEDATWVLTVGWDGGKHAEHCWYEVESIVELRETQSSRVVWNARNPRTGESRHVNGTSVRDWRKGWLCQASRIKGPQDVIPGVEAILIGEGLYT